MEVHFCDRCGQATEIVGTPTIEIPFTTPPSRDFPAGLQLDARLSVYPYVEGRRERIDLCLRCIRALVEQ